VTSRALQERIARRLRKAGYPSGSELAGRLEQYFSLLARWNAKINLTAFNLTDPNDQAIDRLLIEPVVAAQHLPDLARTVIDIGSGSGSPAIPLLLARPELVLTMVEAKTRKAVFLLEALRHLEAKYSRVETARFEQLLTRPDLHEAFDCLTIRAVRVESSTLLTLQAFLKPGGDLVLFQASSRAFKPDLSSFPLVLHKATPLLESLGSQLVILRKMFHVERG
jgi:16S rRNA (guanine527-N7)-methyltransferase